MEPSVDIASEPVTTRSTSARKGVPDRRTAHWEDAEVAEVIEETPDAVTLRLRLEASRGFLPGQYYNVRLPVPGRPGPVQRAYSIASAPLPDPSIIDLGVREVPDGLISPRLVRDLSPGDRLDVRGPAGRFTWTADDGGPVLLVGAGSGVVPLMSMIRYGVAVGLDVPMRLVCSSPDFGHAFYHQELVDLAERCRWLEVVHCFTRDPSDPRAVHHRRIDRIMMAEAVAGRPPRRVYICGPPGMVEDVQGWLGDVDVDPARVRSEKYD